MIQEDYLSIYAVPSDVQLKTKRANQTMLVQACTMITRKTSRFRVTEFVKRIISVSFFGVEEWREGKQRLWLHQGNKIDLTTISHVFHAECYSRQERVFSTILLTLLTRTQEPNNITLSNLVISDKFTLCLVL